MVITPVKVDRLIKLLKDTNYDHNEIRFLEEGFTHGFDIGYAGPELRRSCSENLPFNVGNETIVWNKIMKEVKLKRVAGPFDQPPFENFIQSSVGLVPKAGGGEI